MEIKRKIIECFEEINIYIEDYNIEDELSKYILDSFQFISFVTSLENVFCIEISDDDLTIENFLKLKDVENLIKKIL